MTILHKTQQNRKSRQNVRVAAISALILAVAAAPVQGFELIDPERPDMCDDHNGPLVTNDSFEKIDEGTQNKRAVISIVPIAPDIIIDADTGDWTTQQNNAVPGVLRGTMYYSWAIWECRDYTGINSAGFFVYKGYSNTAEDQGIWSMGEYDHVIAGTPQRFMYKCDEANCDQNFEPLARQHTLVAAEAYAKTWPTYSTASSSATLNVKGETLSFRGTYEVSGDALGLVPSHTFTGCSASLDAVCVKASAAPSLIL